MLARTVGIALLLCLWNEFNTVQGQTASQACQYNRRCRYAVVYHQCSWYGCQQHVVIVERDCLTGDTCVPGSGTNPAWSTCTASCTPGGTRSRVNTCNRASSTGNTCTYSETESCNALVPCTGIVVNGNWGLWNNWSGTSACSVTCCEGTQAQIRTRQCDNPAPSGGGATCAGDGTETRAAGPCGSLDNQCPLTCPNTETTFADTCRRCVQNYYTCSGVVVGAAPVNDVCGTGLVWTNQIQACTTLTVCNSLEPQL